MEQFIQIMIANADLRLLPVKAIARWPPDIRIHISALDNSFVIGPSRTGIWRTRHGDTMLLKTRNSRVASRVPGYFF